MNLDQTLLCQVLTSSQYPETLSLYSIPFLFLLLFSVTRVESMGDASTLTI
jgi:hypothetical protein